MDKNFGMGLKTPLQPDSTNPFTKVNGNVFNSFAVLLPSALADGFDKLLLKWALASLIIVSLKYLIQ